MAHPSWPLFDLVVRTPRLELRAIDDELGAQLATLAAQGIHDPAAMPFAVPWTDVAPPRLQVNTLQYYWHCRATLSPAAWTVDLAVLDGGVLVGTTGLMAQQFPTLRTFETGSWLGRAFQGRGIGTEMRIAALHLGFVGFGAQFAATSAFADNPASLGVTRKLGYEPNGESIKVRRGAPAPSLQFRMSAEHFDAHVRRADVELIGVEPCCRLLGLT
ncbi:MAG: GNAT family protein [Ilumatobacteraceae bacterium]